MGVQEPSDGMAVEEGVATESPCDAVAAQETPPSTCNASAASELSMAAAGSCEDKISVPMERASVVEALVHEPAKSFTEDGTTNINASEINASIHDVSAASAVRDSSEGNITLSETNFALNIMYMSHPKSFPQLWLLVVTSSVMSLDDIDFNATSRYGLYLMGSLN